jgi:hypothetical protein
VQLSIKLFISKKEGKKEKNTSLREKKYHHCGITTQLEIRPKQAIAKSDAPEIRAPTEINCAFFWGKKEPKTKIVPYPLN